MLALVWIACFITYTVEANTYPIVFVYGYGGWDRSELFGLKYFGGLLGDLQAKLQLKYPQVPIYTANIGKISSNWDRACELFANIRGGTTDYGEAHSAYYNHSRFGPTFDGFYPEWGTLDDNGDRQKIHLIGHSMGGLTARMLAFLLHNGAREQIPIPETAGNLSALFQGDKTDWIHSITTISTPHQGSTLASMDNSWLNFGLKGFSAIFGLPLLNDYVFDMKLEQFGLQRNPKESYFQYISRLKAHPIFQLESQEHQDTGFYELTLAGAEQFNQYVKDAPGVFYISYATADTTRTITFQNGQQYTIHRPNIWMYPPYIPVSLHIGGVQTLLYYNKTEIWQQNDGVLNTGSMQGPPDSIVVAFDASRTTFETGQWYQFPQLDGFDHISGIGWTFAGRSHVLELYTQHIHLLTSLTSQRNLQDSRRLQHQLQPNATILQGISTSIAQFQIEASHQIGTHCRTSKLTSMELAYCSFINNI